MLFHVPRIRPEKLGGGVRHAFQNPYPIYDQNMQFPYPIYDLTRTLMLYLDICMTALAGSVDLNIIYEGLLLMVLLIMMKKWLLKNILNSKKAPYSRT